MHRVRRWPGVLAAGMALALPHQANAEDNDQSVIYLDGALFFEGWAIDTPLDLDGTLKFDGFGGRELTGSVGTLTFTGLGGPAIDDSVGILSFTGLGDPEIEDSIGTLSFTGLGDPEIEDRIGTLAFTGWGGSLAPEGILELGMRGWGVDGGPGDTQDLAMKGWGGEASPDGFRDLVFRGWGDAAASWDEVQLRFFGLGVLPPPCSPADYASGNLVARPSRNPANEHHYQRFTCITDWWSAHQACDSVGAHLVTIVSAEEQDYVAALARGCDDPGCWLGGTDSDVEGSFRWVTGEPFGYRNWKSGEPNDDCDGEDFLHIRTGGDWNDQAHDGSCHNWGLMQYICEWEARE